MQQLEYTVLYMEQYKDLNLIRTFVRVAEAQSFTQAARTLGLQKSKVSRQIAQLEQDLGVQLLYRSTRSFHLTEVGQRLLNNTKGLIQSLDEISANLHTEQIRGSLRITAPADWSGVFLPEILEEFRLLHPGVKFDVLLTQETLNLVNEKVDVAFRVGSPKSQTYRMRILGQIEFAFVGHPRFLELLPKRIEEVEDLPLVRLSETDGSKPLSFSLKGKNIRIKPSPLCTTNNPDFVLNLALRGVGLAFLPKFLIADELNAGRLVTFYDEYKSPTLPLSILTPYHREVPETVRLFTELAGQRIKERLQRI